jgi:hypothetical protein
MTIRRAPAARLTRTGNPRVPDKAPALPSTLSRVTEVACDTAPKKFDPNRALRLPRVASSA